MSTKVYHEITAFCFLIIAMIWASAAITKRFADKSYFALNTSILLFALVDSIWGMAVCGQIPCSNPMRMVLCSLYFIFLVLSIVTLAHYLARRLRTRALVQCFQLLFLGIFGITAAVVVINFWSPILFEISPDGRYVRGSFFPVLYFGILLLYAAMLIPILRGQNSDRRERGMLLISYMVPMVLTLLQYLLPDFPFFIMAFTMELIGTALTVEYQQRRMLMDALAAAEHANSAKTTFLSNMSHDIRTPMNAIIGFTALAGAHVDEPEIVQDYLTKISTSSQHLLSLINDVLDMSRIESGKVQIEEKEVHLPDVMHDLRTIINANVVSKNIEFFIDAVDVKNEDVLCDKLRLNQVLLNLVSNAVKFSKSGGQVIVRIVQKPVQPNGYATYEFHVKDNGIGMSKEFQKHLFEAFTREETSTVSGIQGTGLGMAITKNIVTMMNGTISVESTDGKGTEFTVRLPFKVLHRSARYEIIPQLEGVRVLVADDDSNTAISVSRMVQEIGMRGEWTLSGKEAVLRAKVAVEQGDEFGAYIIDWMMPDLNGIETVRRIRRVIGDSKPIIILTAYDWSDIEQEAREAGVTAFCSKPLFLSELREVLSEPFRIEKPEPDEPPEKKYDLTGRKVLVVEDNALNQEIAKSLLEEAGCTVTLANDGDVAVEKLRRAKAGQYDAVLMDIQMPRLDGYSATRQIRTLDSPAANLPIIAMTANAFEDDRRKAIESGMNAHIAKPIEVDTLLSTLAKLTS